MRHRDVGNAAHELARALTFEPTVASVDEALALLRLAEAAYAPGEADMAELAADRRTMTALRAELAPARSRRSARATSSAR